MLAAVDVERDGERDGGWVEGVEIEGYGAGGLDDPLSYFAAYAYVSSFLSFPVRLFFGEGMIANEK